MDSKQGVPFWPQPDFETQSPWASIVPAKPAPVDDQMNQPPYGMGFLDLLYGNYEGGFFQSILPPDSNSSSVPDYADQFPHRNTKGLFPGSNSSAVPNYAVGQVQDLSFDSGAAAGLGYSGDVQGPQISGDDLGPGTATRGDPSDGWQRTTHTNLLAYADAAAVANKAPFFTPLLLSQIEGGCTMPIAPERSSINGNEMVSSSLYNSDLNLMTQSFFSSEPELDEKTSEPDINKHMPIQPQNLPQNAITLGHVNEMANRKGCTPSQLTLAWLHHQGGDVFPIPGATGIENFNQNIAPLSVELTPEEMAELESYASANVVKDDRHAQETTDRGNRYLMPQYTWTPGSLEIKRPPQTHTPPEFINMDNRDLMPQYLWTPARTEKHRPLQTQMPTEFNTGNRDFMPQCPWTPKNQEINRPPDTRMPPEIIDLVDDFTSEQNNWEEARKSQTSTAKQAKLCLLEPLAPPPLTPLTPVSLGAAMPFESAFVQQQHADTEGVVSSAEAIDQATTAETQDLLENDGIDLNKAPGKKPKRKKHRPKVIREGKPARTPKPATPMTKNPSGKRKYVRKNKTEVTLETLSAEPGSNDGSRQEYSSQKQHHKRKNHPKNSPENPYSNPGGAAELESRYRNNSVRRQLDFSDEVARDAYPRSTLMLTNNVECQYQEAYHARNAIKTDAAASVHQTKVVPGFPVGLYSSTNQEANEHLRLPDKNFQPCGTQSMRTDHILDEFQTREQQAVGNLVPGFPSGLYSSANQEANEHSRLADKVQPCRTESVRTDQILDEFRIPENPVVPPQISKRENMKRLARKSFLRYASNSDRSQEPDIIQLDSLKTSDMPRKRRISDYILDNNAQNLMIINSIQAADRGKKLNRSHNARHHDAYLSQVYNKQGTEHENRFTLKTASSLMCAPSNDFRRHQVKSDTAKAFIYTGVKTQLASEDMLLFNQPENNTAKRSKLALVPYSHSSINSAQDTLEQNKLTAPLESFPCNYKQYSTKSRMKDKAEIFIHTNQEDLQGQKSLCYPLDDVIQMLRHLTLNKSDTAETAQAENAIVHYGGNLALVPYEPKKPRPRAKVDLDPETNRVWNRLMGKEVGEDRETEVDKEKWEEERRLFSVRVDSFIDRMHLVQGDRGFSKWKGSVVDSVVGVFLTQNVSDHLSSSAFMALAARFPRKSRCKNFESSADESESCMKHEDSSIETVKGNSKWQEQISSDKHLHGSSPLVIATNNEIANSNESFGSNSSDTVANYTKVRCVDPKERVIGISHDSPDSESSTPMTLTSINLTEAEDRWSVEDAGSSQNSSENPHQVADQIRITSTGPLNCVLDASDQPCSRDFAAISGSVPVADLLDIFKNSIQPLASAEAETYTRKQFYSANNLGTDLNEAPFAEHISKQNESVFEIHRAVQSQLQNQNFDDQQNSAVSEAVFQSQCVGDVSDQPYSHFSERANINKLEETRPSSEHTGNISEVINQQDFAAASGSVPVVDLYGQNCMQPLATAEVESYPIQQFTSPNNHETNLNVAPLAEAISQQDEGVFEIHSPVQSQHQKQNFDNQQNSASLHNTSPWEASKSAQLDLKDDAYILKKATDKTPKIKAKEKKVKKNENERNKTFDWDSLRREVDLDGSKERSQDTMDSVDWEAVRSADVKEISQAIKERGMNNMLAERIKEFLNRLVNDHGSIDLEWLRKIEPGNAKDYLLSIRGLGLKSVECVRLLTLHNLAFPVDTNVGRICVRLGWVPLQPLPESVQLHLLELYPVLETIQRYLWPRLCKLDQRTLYELHYQLITFGKVFCTKSKPNCNACPMRGECKHFASAFASATLKLTGPEEKGIVSSNVFAASQENHVPVFNPTQQIYQLEGTSNWTERDLGNCQPIIEEPASPEPECTQIEESEIEDAFYEDPDEIPTIKLNIEKFTQNLQGYMQANNMEIQDVDMNSNLALMITKPEHASIPMPKLKNVSRLRTEHLVYELPDSHPLLEGFEPRESDDPSSYLLAIWTAGETAQSTEPPKESCNSDETGVFCNMATCFTCSHRRELQAQIVRGTILIPCRTAMRGSFPLNGTYFQVNEVFADHDSSRNPIDVPREWIWNLPRRTVFFGTSVTSIFKGLTTEHIQSCFWRGCVCVRGFDRKTRAPRPLYARLHLSASKAPKNKQQEKGSSAKTNNTSQKGSIIS